jgi:hypothetical protein
MLQIDAWRIRNGTANHSSDNFSRFQSTPLVLLMVNKEDALMLMLYIWPIFFSVAQELISGLGRLTFQVSRSHAITYTRPVGLLWKSETVTYTTQQTQDSNIHALSRIRTRNPSKRLATDLRIWQHGHRDWHVAYLTSGISLQTLVFLSRRINNYETSVNAVNKLETCSAANIWIRSFGVLFGLSQPWLLNKFHPSSKIHRLLYSKLYTNRFTRISCNFRL